MRSSRVRLFRQLSLVCALGLASLSPLGHLAVAAPSAPAFAQATSDLPVDPAVRFGSLPNGVRYAVRANAEPKGRASLRVFVDVGSFAETEEQRGIAHFLEHMAFNGSVHYAPGTLVEFFQRMGMSFGGDTNASTGFDGTQYLLELADTSDKTLTEGIQVFADYAGGLLLEKQEIDKERGIILSEKRARDTVGFRSLVARFEFAFPDTLLPKRLPIGLPEVIQNAPREAFADFYNTWYRPENISVIAVGDFDPAKVEQFIIKAFTPLAARAPARTRPSLGTVDLTSGLRTGYHPEPEAPATTLYLSTVSNAVKEPDTAANRLKDLPAQIAVGILNRRLSVLAKKEGAPFTDAGAGLGDNFHLFREASVSITTKPEQWTAALAVAEQELRRALEHGFQPSEVQEVVAGYRNGLQQAIKTAPTRRSPALANEILEAIKDDQVVTTPEADLALYEPALAKVSAADCLAAFRAEWAHSNRRLFVTGNLVLPAAEAQKLIAEAYARTAATPVAAPAAESQLTWSYTDFGPIGQIVKRERVEDLDLTLVTFANGVRVNLKKTAFEADRISLLVRIGEGAKTEPATKRGLTQLAGATFDAGGLGKYSTDDLRRLLAGKNVGVRFAPGTDAFTFSGATTPDDLRLELQLLTAKITDPGYRPESLRQVQKSIEQLFIGFAHTPNGALSTEVASLLASGDPRFGVPPKDQLLGLTLDDVKAWLTPELAQGAIEVAIVGDLDIEATLSAVASTLGALPTRRPATPRPELLKVAFPAQPFDRSFTFDSEIPKGVVALYWPTNDGLDAHRARRLSLLAAVFSDRLRVKIREEMAGTYSPSARSVASDTFPGYGYLTTSIDVSPELASRIAAASIELADEMAKNGVTTDEVNRSRQPILTSVRESMRTNAYWLGSVLAQAQSKPAMLDWARDREADIAGITDAELDALARDYLGASRVSKAVILPAAPAAAPATKP